MTKENKEEKQVFTIEEKQESNEPSDEQYTEEQLKEEGLSPEEMAMAKEHGFIKEGTEEEDIGEQGEEEQAEEQEEDKTEEVVDEDSDDEKTKDDLDQDLTKEEVEDLSSKERGFYYDLKKEREKRQQALKEKELLEIKLKNLEEKVDSIGQTKEEQEQESIDSMIDNKQAELEKIIKGGDDEFEDGTVAREDLAKYHKLRNDIDELEGKKQQQQKQQRLSKKQKMQQRLTKLEKTAKSDPEQYPNYEDTIQKAQEVMKNDNTDLYAKEFVLAASNPDTGKKPLDIMYRLAQMHPDYNKGSSETKSKKSKEENDKAKRMAKNAKKKKSSASIGASGPRKVAEEDLSVEDVASMSQEQYNKLSPKTRQRLLGR